LVDGRFRFLREQPFCDNGLLGFKPAEFSRVYGAAIASLFEGLIVLPRQTDSRLLMQVDLRESALVFPEHLRFEFNFGLLGGLFIVVSVGDGEGEFFIAVVSLPIGLLQVVSAFEAFPLAVEFSHRW
jgi:hypothetical protein